MRQRHILPCGFGPLIIWNNAVSQICSISIIWMHTAPMQTALGAYFLLDHMILEHNSSAECKKVVSDVFGKFELLMKYQNMPTFCTIFESYNPFSFRNVMKKRCKKRRKCKKHVLVL